MNLPTFYECRDRAEAGNPLSAVEEFILAYNKQPDIEGEPWRDALAAALESVAAVPA